MYLAPEMPPTCAVRLRACLCEGLDMQIQEVILAKCLQKACALEPESPPRNKALLRELWGGGCTLNAL